MKDARARSAGGAGQPEPRCGSSISEGEIQNIMTQVSNGLVFLHSYNPAVIYQNLKPENGDRSFCTRLILAVLYSKSDKSWKIAEFAYDIGPDGESQRTDEHASWSCCYTAPEVLGREEDDQRNPLSNKVDIWSLGCIFLELKNGVKAFAGIPAVRTYCQSPDPLPNSVSQDSLGEALSRMIRKMLAPKPLDRPTAYDVHKYFSAQTAPDRSTGDSPDRRGSPRLGTSLPPTIRKNIYDNQRDDHSYGVSEESGDELKPQIGNRVAGKKNGIMSRLFKRIKIRIVGQRS
jgi:serine/threonine protein kinase